MASIGIRPGGKLSFLSSSVDSRSNSVCSANPNLSYCGRIKPQCLRASITPSSPPIVSSSSSGGFVEDDSDGRDGDFQDKIDTWMKNSVEDILKNLKQAPLLVSIFSVKDGRVRIQTEKAIMERWPEVKNQWETGEPRSPDGLILVDELEHSSDKDDDQDLGEGVTRAWGLVVQGKGVERGPACYLLKTNRVCGGMGLGFCTHFCLMRVNNFRDTALEQFRDSWLLK